MRVKNKRGMFSFSFERILYNTYRWKKKLSVLNVSLQKKKITYETDNGTLIFTQSLLNHQTFLSVFLCIPLMRFPINDILKGKKYVNFNNAKVNKCWCFYFLATYVFIICNTFIYNAKKISIRMYMYIVSEIIDSSEKLVRYFSLYSFWS